MLHFYAVDPTGPRPIPSGEDGAVPAEARWIDLFNPDATEDRAVESLIGTPVPTREEVEEIEYSSRFYTEATSVVMTASLLVGVGQGRPHLSPLTFVLTEDRLATIR
jgi:magnesium transporter